MKKVKKCFRSYSLLIALFISSCAPALVHALEVDQETEVLILDSIQLELINNIGLKDPVDNLPLDVYYSSMVILGKSVQFLNDGYGSSLYSYQVVLPYSSLDGERGTLICTAFFDEKNGVKKASKAKCDFNQTIYLDNNSPLLIDEP